MKIATVHQMRQIDRLAAESFGIPSLSLMENAGAAVARECVRILPAMEGARILVVCGKGNNGGDGFVAARHLQTMGAKVSVLCTSGIRGMSGDAKLQCTALLKCGIKPRLVGAKASIKRLSCDHDLCIDALLGTGLRGQPNLIQQALIDWMNSMTCPVVSVDIPSGMQADTAALPSDPVHAHTTVTLGLPKTGMVFEPARQHVGRLVVDHIGLPAALLGSKKIRVQMSKDQELASLLPRRSPHAHKSTLGRILVVAGSKGMSGAALLSSQAAMKTGAGVVVLACPSDVQPIVAKSFREVMTLALPQQGKTLDLDKAVKMLSDKISKFDVLAMGPGMGQDAWVRQLILRLLPHAPGKVVLDADALNAMTPRDLKLLPRKTELVLTPHQGEFRRLFGDLPSEGGDAQILRVGACARLSGATIHLKGAPALTVSPDGLTHVNTSGNPGMATAGSGDVLTGIVAGLLGQGLEGTDAARLGAWLHGLAGDMAREKKGLHSMLAGDILQAIPECMKWVESMQK